MTRRGAERGYAVVDLVPETRISFNRAGLRFAKEPKLVLPGASVAELTIPVVAEPKAKGRYSLAAVAKVSGDGGTRVRRWRAQGLPTRIPPWLTVLGIFAGHLFWGGGLKVRVRVCPRAGAGVPPAMSLEPQTAIVWLPESHDLAAAAAAAAV